MKPPLRGGETAQGILAGMDAIEHDLRFGPPPPPKPSAFQRALGTFARLPMNVIAIVASLGASIWLFRRRREVMPRHASASPQTTPPNDLPPAIVGALVKGRVSNAQVQGTILDLARRGALVLEPTGQKTVQVRLKNHKIVQGDFEDAVGASLAAEADDHGIIDGSYLPKVAARWPHATSLLTDDLRARGWFDAQSGAKHAPFYIIGAVLVALAVGAFVIAIAGSEGWGVVATLVFAAGSALAFWMGYSVPETTAAGEAAAVPWRGYLAGIERASHDASMQIDLDRALPYAVAMGAEDSIKPLLERASNAGYMPAWFLQASKASGGQQGRQRYGFYPYWVVFHSAMAPPTSSGSSGSSGGSAASGGGGAGGSF